MFIEPQHPKASMTRDQIKLVLGRGWIGQPKINGARLQLHLEKNKITCFTRQGSLHTVAFPEKLSRAFLQFFSEGTVLDCEWLRFSDKVFIFDLLKKDGELLRQKTYRERYKLLKSVSFIHPDISVLPIFTTERKCLGYLNQHDDSIEGLVFRAFDLSGWSNSSILRLRRE